MKSAALLALVVAFLAEAHPAHAVSACNNNFGVAPKPASVLPAHARILVYDTDHLESEFMATLDGKQVPIKVTTITSTPYDMRMIEIDSDKTGKLVVFRVFDAKNKWPLAKYKVSARAPAMPTEVSATLARAKLNIRHTSVEEKYDALALRVGDDTPAILATVKLRRDSNTSWSTLQMPVTPGDGIEKHTAIRIGELGCVQNFSASMLETGVDIEASVTLVDGTTRAVKLPAHVAMP